MIFQCGCPLLRPRDSHPYRIVVEMYCIVFYSQQDSLSIGKVFIHTQDLVEFMAICSGVVFGMARKDTTSEF
jgi:hypothetical protein